MNDQEVLNQASPEAFEEAALEVDLIAWSLKNRPLVRAKVPNVFEGFYYLDEIYTLDHPEKVVMKSAQCRISEYALNEALWKMTTQGWNIFYAFPHFTKCRQFVRGRVDKAVVCSPYLQQQLRGENFKTLDNVYTKSFGAGTIYFSGAKTTAQITTADADMLYMDEFDEFPPETAAVAPDRLGNSIWKWQRKLSKPSFENMGIHAAHNASDQRIWHVKCEACSKWQLLDYYAQVDRKAMVLRCPNRRCQKALPRTGPGLWVASFNNRDAVGWQISKTFTPTAKVSELVKKEREATDEFKKQAFVNGDLGLPYSPKGASIPRAMLNALVDQGYEMPDIVEDGYTFLGADPGAVIHVRINRYEKGMVYPVFIGTLPMDVSLSALEPYMRRYRVNQAVIDGQYETSAVTAFCKKHPKRAWANWWNDNLKTILLKPKPSEYKLESHRTMAFDAWYYSRMEGQQMVLPINAPVIPEYFNHLMKGRRVKGKNAKGTAVVRWMSAKPDHYLLADVYAELALRMFLDMGYGRRVKTMKLKNRAGIVATRSSTRGLP